MRSNSAAGPRASQNGHVDGGAAGPERRLQPAPQVAPRDRLRAAELDRPVRALPVDGEAHGADEVVDPDRLDPLRAGPDHRCQRKEPCDAHEPRQRSTVRPEHEARAQHDVIDAARRDRLLGRPLGAEVGDGRARPRPQGAHQDDAPDTALARGLDEVPGPRGHDALERRGRSLDDRHEVDDRAHPAGGRPERRRIGHVAAHEVAVDAFERLGAACRPHHRAYGRRSPPARASRDDRRSRSRP